MGMPAATITSLTAHGGTVILGFPQVLINFMPASRVTDMHVCPMVTGIVPHVGGPFILGSATVLTGMMMQSRVTDQLTCVGPPDICVMGAETVLVGEAGAGGAAGAAAGVAAMGTPVPMQPTATQTSPQPTAELQSNGTLKTAAPPGGSLPAIPLSSAGFPTLPPEETPNFESAQPVDIPAGTTLYRVIGDPARGAGGYWTTELPTSENDWRQSCAVGAWNPGTLVAIAQVPPGGLKAWVGMASAQDGGLLGGGTQLWTPPGSLIPGAMTQAPWSGAAQQLQQAAQQTMQGAQQAANQAQQAASQAEQQAQQAAKDAEQGAQQAAQQVAQQAQQTANQAQQDAQQAQQQAQKAMQQSQQAVQQAQQQAQQAVGQAKGVAQQAVTQAQQQEQQVQQQAQQASQQAQKAAQQAQQAANQAQQSVQQAGQQAGQAAQQAIPKGLP
jgi:uncharacterized Zn-binding protein involved in type VI secretion